jgi:hypothetical protein
MNAQALLRKTFFLLTVLALLAVGFSMAPLLGRATVYLVLIGWLGLFVGYLHSAEAIPWIAHLKPLARLLGVFAPPLTPEEKTKIWQRDEEREKARRRREAEREKARRRQEALLRGDLSAAQLPDFFAPLPQLQLPRHRRRSP